MNLAIFMLSTLLSVNAQTSPSAPVKPTSAVPAKPQVSAPGKPTVSGPDSSKAQIKFGETGDVVNPAKSFQDGNSAVAVTIPNPSSTSDILRRLASMEVLVAKLERRVLELEAKQKAAEAQSGR